MSVTAAKIDLADAFPSREHTYYGRSACGLGEDGEQYMAAGHDRHAYAALNAVARYDGGTRPFLGLPYTITQCLVTFVESCGCAHADHQLHGHELPDGVEEDSTEAERYGECWEHCEHSGLPPCGDEYGWMVNLVSAGTPGAVPVLMLRVGLRR